MSDFDRGYSLVPDPVDDAWEPSAMTLCDMFSAACDELWPEPAPTAACDEYAPFPCVLSQFITRGAPTAAEVERVARAIDAELGGVSGLNPYDSADREKARFMLKNAARAAIAAMRAGEP